MNPPKPIPFKPPSVVPPLSYDFQAWQEIDPALIPRLRFAYGDTYAVGYLSVTFAAPKTGKSLLALSEAIDAATGRGFLTGRPSEPIRVLYYNAEDDLAVIQGRVCAVLQAWNIPQSEIAGRLFVVSGVTEESPVVLIEGLKGEIVEPAFQALSDLIKREGIDLEIFDPLQDLSQSPETNEVFRALGGRIRALASDTGAAVGLIHHTRKPSPGIMPTLDDGRGGSALRGVARFNRLLVPMTEAEGAKAGVDDFRRYFRIGEAESNFAPPSSDRNRWFEKTSEVIANGENVATIRPWTWPDAFIDITVSDTCRVRAAIAARDAPPRENSQAGDWAGKIVAAVLGLDLAKPSDKAKVKALLKKWIETDVLRVETLPHGDKGKTSPCVVAGENSPAVHE
ncbi:MAG: AAA family ATPase [Albidovulum sp.]|uniref:AAA family ATPase n=1 Tax=Albidovulum sp. TaxID=1872424 RepID=UPI003C842AB4